MNYAQLVTHVQAQTLALGEKQALADEHRQQITWYDGLDPDAAIANAQDAVAAVAAELAEVAKERTAAQARLQKPAAPRLALGRAAAVVVVIDTARMWHGARKKLKTLTARKAELEFRHGQLHQDLNRARTDGEQHAVFDRPASAERLAELEDEIAALESERGRLAQRLDAIDEKVTPLKNKLDQVREELSRMGNRRNGRYHSLRSDERRLDTRIRKIERKGTMDVRTVIIDGSNFFYDDENKKAGFFALRPLCDKLLEDKMVQVVFDYTIISKQGVRTKEQVEALLPGIDPHIAESKTDADELIFFLADDPTTYILSNDRYPEYETEPAHADDRVFPVEIVRGQQVVVVPMLDLAVPYTHTR